MTQSEDVTDVPVATDGDYRQETRETDWVVLEDAYMRVEVETAAPYKFLADLEQYGLQSIVEGDVDVQEMDEQEAQDAAGDLSEFMQSVVVDRVITPHGYWGDDSSVPADEDGFDVSQLTENDMSTIIQGIIGQGSGDFDPDRFQG